MLTLLVMGVCVLSAMSAAVASDGICYPGDLTGQAVVVLSEDVIILENKALSASWSVANKRLRLVSFADKSGTVENTAENGEAFTINMGDGHTLKASEFTLAAAPESKDIAGNANAHRLVERYAGRRVSATLIAPDNTFSVVWEVELRDASNYIIQRVTLLPVNQALPVGKCRRRTGTYLVIL